MLIQPTSKLTAQRVAQVLVRHFGTIIQIFRPRLVIDATQTAKPAMVLIPTIVWAARTQKHYFSMIRVEFAHRDNTAWTLLDAFYVRMNSVLDAELLGKEIVSTV